MSWGGLTDPDAIDDLARHVEAKADEVRDALRSFRTAVAEVEWQSQAAASYRRHCRDIRQDLRRNAEDLDEVAAKLRAHADLVRERIAWVEEQVQGLKEKARAAADAAEEAFEWGADKADDAFKEVMSWF